MSLPAVRQRTVVIGCGSEFVGDDAAGLEVLRRLTASPLIALTYELLSTGRIGTELLHVFDRAESIVFIDAVVSPAPTGTIVIARLPSEAVMMRHGATLSSHGWGVPEAVSLAMALGRRLPRLTLLGIDIEDAIPGAPLSAPVAASVDYVVDHFDELMERIIRMHELGAVEMLNVE